ncbi:hypothetical protein [Pseudomonas sp. LB3P14]
MAYDDKAHRHEHQMKVRLDDEVFQELKDVARDMKLHACGFLRPLSCWPR